MSEENKRFYRSSSVSVTQIAEGTCALLTHLLSRSTYSEDMTQIYQYVCYNGVENFLYREFLAYTDVIQVTLPQYSQGEFENQAEQEFYYRAALVYFFHCRFNAKLNRCTKEKYEMRVIDSFLANQVLEAATECRKVLKRRSEPEWYCYCPEKKKTENLQEQTERREMCARLFETAARLSVTLELPDVDYRWSAPKHRQGGDIPIRLLINWNRPEDIKSYSALIQYFLKKEHNFIHTYTEYGLWQTELNLNPRSNGKRISQRNSCDTDLMLFSLALGLGKEQYERLRYLRGKRFGYKPPPQSGDRWLQKTEEQQELLTYLQKSSLRLSHAKKETKEHIPRRMLVNAAIDMINNKLCPAVVMTKKEVDEAIQKGTLSEEAVRYVFVGENGKNTVNPLLYTGQNALIYQAILLEPKEPSEELIHIYREIYRMHRLGVVEGGTPPHATKIESSLRDAGVSEEVIQFFLDTPMPQLTEILDTEAVRNKFRCPAP